MSHMPLPRRPFLAHWEHLARYIPQLPQLRLLDIGSGRGGFLIEATRHLTGGSITGLESSNTYIDITHAAGAEAGYPVNIVLGHAEELPFEDHSFDVVHMNEIIEHVQDPSRVLAEAYRVLRPGGFGYLSIPNRYGIKDQHYHLYFINWMPRRYVDHMLSLCGFSKEGVSNEIGVQRLSEMHYYTFAGAEQLLQKAGFIFFDIRLRRITERFGGWQRAVVSGAYLFLKPFYFDSFHFILEKPASS